MTFDAFSVTALALLIVIWGGYIAKMMALRRKGIKADILGKGDKPRRAAGFELVLKMATYAGVACQFYSVMADNGAALPLAYVVEARACGMALMTLGAVSYVAAITAMRTNWRAGFAAGQGTDLVTGGAYRYSRNPAFLGFDLFNLGIAMVFPNALTIAYAFIAAILFHIQIRGEEGFLQSAFGDEYAQYKAVTMRYFGRRRARCAPARNAAGRMR